MSSLFLLFVTIGMLSAQVDEKKGTMPDALWTLEAARLHHEKQFDPNQWDQKLLAVDIKGDPFTILLPMEEACFPVAPYQGAAGAIDYLFSFGDRILKGGAFSIGRNEYNESTFQEGDAHQVFFNVLVLTDVDDEEEYNLVLSRNHPHYLGQGKVLTSTRPVEYMCFTTADQNSYAIVNSRIFDARLGRTILAAPQKDGSIRFLQLDYPYLGHNRALAYMAELLKRAEVQAFFRQEGNI